MLHPTQHTCSTQVGVGTPLGANNVMRLIGGRNVKQTYLQETRNFVKINKMFISTSIFRQRRNRGEKNISILKHLGN
jgi:hypothetical protein